ncbi:unnamed protein product [Chrysodeixis includens]|uniref:C2H2-type domain-containing protein n=1 Tax=Chrysodeixis includens TaxID=689277 RepID=A0A9P0BZS6_CHRIL|nr:unnamed protein product [Chrysodeixis includens]
MSVVDQEGEPEVLDEEFLNFSGDGDTTCTICRAEFLDPDDLNIHIAQIHKNTDNNENTVLKYSKKCQFCPTTYSDFINYAEHLRDEHILNLKYCNYCLRAFKDFDDHRNHEKRHKIDINKPSYNCATCKAKFGNTSDLKRHDLEQHANVKSNSDGIMILEVLPFLSAVLNMKLTKFIHLLSDTDPTYACVACDFFCENVNRFLEHSRKQDCMSYVCSKCAVVYKKKFNIVRHMAKDCNGVQGSGKTVICPECNLVFNKHLFPKHKKNCKVIKCYTCGIYFETMYELSEHQSTEHPLSIELKTCKYCQKQCVGSVSLQKHIDRSHKGKLHLYKYQCITCKSIYKHPQNLFAHYFSKHKDLDPYTCKICDKKFHIRKKFTVHIKIVHKCIGFVEFDKNYHVFFTETKSDNPFVPKSLYNSEKTNNVSVDSNRSNVSMYNRSEMSVTETEGNITEVEKKRKQRVKRKPKPKPAKKKEETITLEESSDDEPLIAIKNRYQKTNQKTVPKEFTKKELTNVNKRRFTCNICKKYCYTYQNYNHHVTLHSTKDFKKCIKCSKVFKSKDQLSEHITNDHSTSKLTETLKNLLEKRKKGQKITDDLPMSERFRRTIKKADTVPVDSFATISTVDTGLSVKNFLENFTPEPLTKTAPEIDHTVSLKEVIGPMREPTIKMTKFEPKPMPYSTKLQMPTRFKECYSEKQSAIIKVVQTPVTYDEAVQTNDYEYSEAVEEQQEKNEAIPDVAEEIMLEGTEDTSKLVQIPHRIVIPNLPMEFKDIRIAHLLPQAPYYKIVKVHDVLQMQGEENHEPEVEQPRSGTINLPDGTKFVNTNPLAHLLGEMTVEKVLEPIKNKYYKPKPKNFQGMLAEALSNLDKPVPSRKKRRKLKHDISMNLN